MFRATLVLAVSLFLTGLVFGQDNPEVAALKKQLAEAEAKVQAIKEKIRILDGDEVTVFKDAKLYPGALKVGERGRLYVEENQLYRGGHRIAEIIDETTIRMRMHSGNLDWPDVIVRGFPTKGRSDGDWLDSDFKSTWKVVGTQKIGRNTLKVLREVSPDELNPEKPIEKPQVVKPKPVPTVKVKATAENPATLAGSLNELAIFQDAKQKDSHAGLLTRKRIVVFTSDTECELVKRGDTMTEVLYKREKYYVNSALIDK